MQFKKKISDSGGGAVIASAADNPNQIGGQVGEAKISQDPIPVTQTFGQPSQYDVFSGGVNTGVDFKLEPGTPLPTPKGTWTVQDSYYGAQPGYIGDGENQGYGNSIVIKNNDTGETIRFSHLNDVYVPTGAIVNAGFLGTTGQTGNVTGPHLDVEYYDGNGQMGDILSTAYAEMFGYKN